VAEPKKRSGLGPADYALAFVTAVLIAESPFTPNERGPSLAIGCVVAAYLLWYRSHHRDFSLLGDARRVGGETVRKIRSVPLATWATLVLWAAIFSPALAWMYERWTGSFWHNNHSMIVAVLIVTLARGALRRNESRPFDVTLWGLPLLAAGLLLAVSDSRMAGHELGSIGFVISLPGMVLLLLGKSRFRALRLPLAMSIFLIPMPSLISNHLLLRSITAEWTLELLHLIGIRASLYYSRIETANHTFIVSEACSGFSTLVAAVSLSFFLFAACPSRARRLILLASILPLTLVANAVRVTLLVVLSMSVGIEVLETALHEASGVLTFVFVLGSLFLIAGRPHITEVFR